MERVNPQIPSHLENSFNAKVERHFTHTETDVLAQFLIDKRNPSTRKAYSKDLNDFFGEAAIVGQFFHPNVISLEGVVMNGKKVLNLMCNSNHHWQIFDRNFYLTDLVDIVKWFRATFLSRTFYS